MNRLSPLNPVDAQGKAKDLLDAVKSTFGAYPTLFRIAAQSPVALDSMLHTFGALGHGTLGAKLQEQVALLVSEQNSCDWCLGAHSAIGRKQGLPQAEVDAARDAKSSDPKAAAALKLASQIVSRRGHVSDNDIAAAKAAGFTDGQIVEIVANVALTIFTNYVNNVAKTQLDFPAVSPRPAPVTV